MPENKFEKEAQERLEELRFSPDASVWLRVEKELKAKKKRRVVFFFLLLAGIAGLGYSGYFLSGKEPGSASVSGNGISAPYTKVQQPVPSPAIRDNIKERPLSSAAPDPAVKEQPLLPPRLPATTSAPSGNRSATTAGDAGIRRVTKVASKAQPRARVTVAKRAATPVNDQVWAGAHPVQPREMRDETPASVLPALPAGNDTTSIAVTKINEDENMPPPAGADKKTDTLPAPEEHTDAVAVTQKKKNAPWKLGFDLSGGITSNRSGFLSLGSSSKNMSYDYSSPSTSTGGPLANSIIIPPSPVTAGFSFKLGGVAERKISRRSSISAGLRYAYLAQKIKTGAYRDTTVLSGSYQSNTTGFTGVYRGQQTRTYNNRYHFIELPLYYQLQLNRSNKLALTWNNGLSVSYLFATNALVYDTAAGGIYIRNHNALNKLQVNVHTGFSFRFGRQGGLQWSVGPELSMALTRLIRQEPFIKKRYLLYSGVTARFLLPSSKK